MTGNAVGRPMVEAGFGLSAGVAAFLSLLLRRHVRGSTRLTLLFARRLRGLQAFPVAVEGARLFLDLREPSSHAILIGQLPEPEERHLVRTLIEPGQVGLDIGAHWGLFTVLLSEQVCKNGHVWAFEPSPVVLPALSRTVERLGNTTLLPIALSDASGTASLFVPADASMASLGNWTRSVEAPRNRYEVSLDCLDRLVATGEVRRPDFIKCDIEGAEALVFRGATSVLDQRLAPMVLFEVNPAASAGLALDAHAAIDVLETLASPHYRFYVIGAAGPHRLKGRPSCLMNLLGVPEARMDAPGWRAAGLS
jgi:FkbM family methyltransferase